MHLSCSVACEDTLSNPEARKVTPLICAEVFPVLVSEAFSCAGGFRPSCEACVLQHVEPSESSRCNTMQNNCIIFKEHFRIIGVGDPHNGWPRAARAASP